MSRKFTARLPTGGKPTTPSLADLRVFDDACHAVADALQGLKANLEHSLSEVRGEFKRCLENYQAYEAEATALFNALEDAGLPEAEAYISQHPPSAGAIAVLILVTQEKFKTEQARRNAAKKNAAKAKAKKFLQTEWARHKSAYKNNKSAFAREYIARLKRELGVDVTERTIREKWLD